MFIVIPGRPVDLCLDLNALKDINGPEQSQYNVAH